MIIAATGLASEAALARRAGARGIACGGHGARLAAMLTTLIAEQRPAGIISLGIAGGLDPALAIGDVVIGTRVNGMAADADWCDRLAAALPGAAMGSVAGVDVAAFDAAAKAGLYRTTRAAIVDMESHIVAVVAGAHGLPFAILRAVSDGAADSLPHAARVPLGLDGRPRLGRVLAEVARRPWQIPALIGLAGNSSRALAALGRALTTIGPGLAGP